MTTISLIRTLLALVLTASLSAMVNASETLDLIPRTAVTSAFQAEQLVLQNALQNRRTYVVNGITFETGSIEGAPVVLFHTGISMVNAAMTTRLALDRFKVTRIVFSGIAGGTNPELAMGDVIVPDQWSEYFESIFAREENGRYLLPRFADEAVTNFGMIFPQPVQIVSGTEKPKKQLWFPVDERLLAIAKAVSGSVQLNRCTGNHRCLRQEPRIVIGGNGVSGQAFVDNAAFREYAYRSFNAQALDMESAAVAHVAYINTTPFIAFRSLSDLAGGDTGENKFTDEAFLQLASDNAAIFVKAFVKALP
jgi:adenosylhomocysteine nucleosidase